MPPPEPSALRPRSAPPLGALLAAVIVVAADRLALGRSGPWEALGRGLSGEPLEEGIVGDRLALRRFEREDDGRPGVLLVGSSRAEAGLVPELVPAEERPEARLARVAHPGITPFVVRSFVGEMLDVDPAVVVLLLSEFDTHHPLVLVPGASFGDLGATRDLVAATGASWAWSRRAVLERLVLGGLLRSYRWRGVLRAAVADRWTEFPLLDARYAARVPVLARSPELLPRFAGRIDPGEREALFAALEARFEMQSPYAGSADDPYGRPDWSTLPAPYLSEEDYERRMREVDVAMGRAIPRMAFDHLRDLAPFGYARVQKRLVERTVELLRRRGVEVLIVDGPVHPLAPRFYDPAVREDFLAFVDGLAARHGVRFLSADAIGELPAAAFSDVSHLNAGGARRLTEATLAEVGRILAERGGGG